MASLCLSYAVRLAGMIIVHCITQYGLQIGGMWREGKAERLVFLWFWGGGGGGGGLGYASHLSLQGKPAIHLVGDTIFALNTAIQKIATVELQAWGCRADGQPASRFGFQNLHCKLWPGQHSNSIISLMTMSMCHCL